MGIGHGVVDSVVNDGPGFMIVLHDFSDLSGKLGEPTLSFEDIGPPLAMEEDSTVVDKDDCKVWCKYNYCGSKAPSITSTSSATAGGAGGPVPHKGHGRFM